ncbi:MAG: class II aldolase/adducin family protein [Treponemataceae bacterium]
MTDNKELMAELSLAAKRAYTRGLQTGSGGNLSARIPGSPYMIVKASGGSFADCDENGAGWVITDFDGKLKEGETGKPTREFLLHGFLYSILPDLKGVMHSHSPWSIVWADDHDSLPCVTHHSKLKFGCDEIPVVNVQAAVVPKEELDKLAALFKANPNLPAFILRGHGIVAVGDSILEAEHTAELVEETAQIALFTKLSKRNNIL